MAHNFFQRLFVNKTDSIFIQFFRYFFVGGFAFVVDFSLLWLLTDIIKFNYLFSAALAFIAGLFVNYIISILWIFTGKGLKNKKVEFGIFALIGVVGLLFNELFIWLFTEIAGFYYLISKVFSTAIVYFWNFFARKYILYKD